MSRLSEATVAVAIAATVLAGCSEAKKVPGPKSGLLPAVELPVDSHQFQAKTLDGGAEVEHWDVPLSFEKSKEYLVAQLPIGRSFDGAPYEGEESGVDKAGKEEISWTWKREADKLLIVTVSEFSTKPPGDGEHTFVQIATYSS